MARVVKIIFYLLLLCLVPLVTAWSTIPYWLPRMASRWLPDGVTLSVSQPQWYNHAIHWSQLSLNTSQCRLAKISDISFSYPRSNDNFARHLSLQVNDLDVDSDCLATLPPSKATETPLVIGDVLAAIPLSVLSVNHLSVAPWQTYAGKLLIEVDRRGQSVQYQGNALTLTGKIIDQNKLAIDQFVVKLPEQTVTLDGEVTLPVDVSQWPEQGNIAAEVTASQYPHPLSIALNWQGRSGVLSIEDKIKQYALIQLPWQYDDQQFQVINGQWQWLDLDQPLLGGINLTIDQWQKGIDTTRFSGRINLLTQGKRGRGNIVLSVDPRKIGLFNRGVPVQLTGDVNIDDMIMSMSLPMMVSGSLVDPTIAFLPGSLFRAWGQITDELSVNEIRLPLAGTQLTSQGFTGRLQAIVSAENHPWGKVKMNFDGKAEQFIPDKGNWHWRYWGSGHLPPLKATWDIKGSGSWQDTLISFDSQTTGLNVIRYGTMTMNAPRLQVTQPLRWQRDPAAPSLSGELQLTTQKTLFGKRSYLPPGVINAKLSGRTPQDFVISGNIMAKDIGPMTFFSRWDGQRLRGQARWSQQPLTVIQSLIPTSTNIIVRDGTFYAQAAFSAAINQGFIAGGHWVVKHGSAWLKEGDIDGIDFVLPWRLKDNVWQLGVKAPIQLRIKQLNNLFDMTDLSADLKGYYPPTTRRPLTLSNVQIKMLDGRIGMDKLQIPQTQATRLFIEKLELSRLLYVLKAKQFALSGRISGELPLYFNQPDWIVKDGWIKNDGDLTLRLDKDTVESIGENDLTAGIAMDWLRYLEISRSQAHVFLNTQGQLTLHAEIYGVNPLIDKRREVRLRYNHEENIFQLTRSLQFGSNLEDWLQQRYESIAQE